MPTVLKLMKFTQSKLKAEMNFPELVSVCPLKFKNTDDRIED